MITLLVALLVTFQVLAHPPSQAAVQAPSNSLTPNSSRSRAHLHLQQEQQPPGSHSSGSSSSRYSKRAQVRMAHNVASSSKYSSSSSGMMRMAVGQIMSDCRPAIGSLTGAS